MAECSMEGCERPIKARGLCRTHYDRWRKGNPGGDIKPRHQQHPVCAIRGCGRPAWARGWCGTHYSRWSKRGSVELTTPPLEVRFWSKVPDRDDPSDCWLWTGAVRNNGYGAFGRGGAHRTAYELTVGPIPNGLTVDHLCRNKLCVNPSHMEPVTPAENTRRAVPYRGALPPH